VDVVGAETASIMLADPETHALVFTSALGASPAPIGMVVPTEHSIAGAVFTSGEPLIIPDVKEDERHYAHVDAATGYQTRDLVALPLKRWEGKPIGVMEVLNKRQGRFDADDLSILMVISAFTAVAIEQRRLFEDAKLAEVVRRLGDLGHDLRNMLMPVMAGAGLLEAEIDELFPKLLARDTAAIEASRSLCKEIIGMQVKNARRIQERVREIVDCVKGLSAPPRLAPCRIDDVVAQVCQMLSALAAEKAITFTTDGLATLPDIIGDERRLFNAFYNLVNNAIAEVPQGGWIAVRGMVDPGTGDIRLCFEDNGRGMSSEVRESLFSARAISRKAGGTGLGTKIVKDVVDAHHGRITVHSTEGRGTVFTIFLPTGASRPQDRAVERMPVSQP
jgi:signal transduction histidine kinase